MPEPYRRIQVKIFSYFDGWIPEMEQDIIEFCSRRAVIDIKYSTCYNGSKIYYTAMVLYHGNSQHMDN